MEDTNNSVSMLHMFQHPTFFVKDGIITDANQYAQQMDICAGMPIEQLIPEDSDAYANFVDGCLSMTLCVNGANCIAVVVRMDSCDVFHLRDEFEDNQLRAMELAVQHMRDPLGNAISAIAGGRPESFTANTKFALQNLYKLLRLMNNISASTACLIGRRSGMVVCNIASFLKELFQRAEHYIGETEVSFSYTLPDEDIYVPIDEDTLSTAVLNLISNAIKGTGRNGNVAIEVTAVDNKLNICVVNEDNGHFGKDESAFFRYTRGSQAEDCRQGTGFGISMVQLAAAAHNGSVLMDRIDKKHVRFTLTISTKVINGDILRSQSMSIIVSSGQDPCLIALCDVLPESAFGKK